MPNLISWLLTLYPQLWVQESRSNLLHESQRPIPAFLGEDSSLHQPLNTHPSRCKPISSRAAKLKFFDRQPDFAMVVTAIPIRRIADTHRA